PTGPGADDSGVSPWSRCDGEEGQMHERNRARSGRSRWPRSGKRRLRLRAAVTVAAVSAALPVTGAGAGTPPTGAAHGALPGAAAGDATTGADIATVDPQWWRGTDFIVTGRGDTSGYHLSLGREREEYAFRPLATIQP